MFNSVVRLYSYFVVRCFACGFSYLCVCCFVCFVLFVLFWVFVGWVYVCLVEFVTFIEFVFWYSDDLIWCWFNIVDFCYSLWCLAGSECDLGLVVLLCGFAGLLFGFMFAMFWGWYKTKFCDILGLLVNVVGFGVLYGCWFWVLEFDYFGFRRFMCLGLDFILRLGFGLCWFC